MGNVVIRPATASDADAIARVHAQSWWEAYQHLIPDPEHPAFDVERRVVMWRQVLDGPGDGTLVAVDDDEVVGFAATAASREENAVREEELTMIYVLARVYGTGLGQALLDAVLGDRPASLWVAAENLRAIAFYRRNGFLPDGATGTFGPVGATVRLVR